MRESSWSILVLAACVLAACSPAPAPGAADGGSSDDASPCGPPHETRDGHPCRCDPECSPGAVCSTESLEGAPGGACVRLCAGLGECGAGAECHVASGRCRPTCSTNAECPRGRYCDDEGTCRVLCALDAECDSGICNEWSGLCASAEPTGAGVFEPCAAHDECRSGLCASGFCAVLCRADPGTCPEDALCLSAGSGGFCAHPCGPGGSCPHAGLACFDVEGRLACLPESFGG